MKELKSNLVNSLHLDGSIRVPSFNITLACYTTSKKNAAIE